MAQDAARLLDQRTRPGGHSTPGRFRVCIIFRRVPEIESSRF
ncbi:hypothetical protein SEA_XIMENITA_100 [Mycobacterium phage Ximenita]|uniref:Uncharacterized protein n=1 Tax=Mycobacterium phage Ximenita TaxID=2708633 RepID=A0A6G6XSP2_9CAUD|nr:hypothetical protein I5G82_gp007 [Mycobacterium phage Ximenita]QIG61608.1 hypothetical protein SEA_XIMENITA_100 [Mycobacterium phage Ximenita]